METPRPIPQQSPQSLTVIVSQNGEDWSKEFPSLFQAVQFASSLHPASSVHLTVRDAAGKEIIESRLAS
jgi:hypothetical protein